MLNKKTIYNYLQNRNSLTWKISIRVTHTHYNSVVNAFGWISSIFWLWLSSWICNVVSFVDSLNWLFFPDSSVVWLWFSVSVILLSLLFSKFTVEWLFSFGGSILGSGVFFSHNSTWPGFIYVKVKRLTIILSIFTFNCLGSVLKCLLLT